MKILISLFGFLFLFNVTFAQEKPIGGIVFDKDTKFRINRVSILNNRTQKAVFNNTKGEFYIDAKEGDVIITSVFGYKSDTTKITNQTSFAIYLKRLSIRLAEVTITDSVLSAKAKYEEIKKEFNKAYRVGNNKDILTVGEGGAGLGIDALWSTFSKEGKNARRLMEQMEKDYQNAIIDQVFTKSLVTRATSLKGDNLLLFMLNYRPSYAFATKANEYDLVNYIKIAFARFKMNNYYQDVSSLKPIPVQK